MYSFHSGHQNPLLVSWLQMLAWIYMSIALRNPNNITSFAWNFQVNFKQFHVKPKLVLVAAVVVADSSDLRLIPGKVLAFIFEYTISKYTYFLNFKISIYNFRHFFRAAALLILSLAENEKLTSIKKTEIRQIEKLGLFVKCSSLFFHFSKKIFTIVTDEYIRPIAIIFRLYTIWSS